MSYHGFSSLYSLGETCSHVAALLFKVEAYVRLGYTSVSCTSKPCTWNQTFSKKVHVIVQLVDVTVLGVPDLWTFIIITQFWQTYFTISLLLYVGPAPVAAIDFSRRRDALRFSLMAKTYTPKKMISNMILHYLLWNNWTHLLIN